MLSSDWLMKGVFFYQFFVFSAFPPLPGYFIEIYHACKWLGKFVQSLNQYFLANTTYKHGIFLYNTMSYTLTPIFSFYVF